MSLPLEKRTYDVRIYDFDCSKLIDSGETITSVSTVESDQAGFTFGTPVINSVPISYTDGHIAAIGKVIQVQIGGGIVPVGRTEIMCVIRVQFVTSINPAIEATAFLRLTDYPRT